MKKTLWLCLAALVAVVATACSDDDGDIYQGVNNSYVKYELTLNQQLINYYDVTATYTDLDGTDYVVKVETATPDAVKFEKKNTDAGKLSPRVTVTAKRKDGDVTLEDSKAYTWTCTCKISYYSPTNTAKNASVDNTRTFTGSELTSYIAANPRLTLISYGN